MRKGNSSSGYDESMKVVRAPGKNGRTETFFFREKLGRGGIKRENQAEVWADDHTKMQVVASDRARHENVSRYILLRDNEMCGPGKISWQNDCKYG